jgi:hypothetical protein
VAHAVGVARAASAARVGVARAASAARAVRAAHAGVATRAPLCCTPCWRCTRSLHLRLALHTLLS